MRLCAEVEARKKFAAFKFFSGVRKFFAGFALRSWRRKNSRRLNFLRAWRNFFRRAMQKKIPEDFSGINFFQAF
ncbi:MAG: hypothetical protein IJG80_00350 [Selenomonadaceae bacterium]|nr:hypothetical protein [Selenomonadaceae bacterium]MBQ9496308.1 hypothetical protein [Selenomonadaceae bacterium]